MFVTPVVLLDFRGKFEHVFVSLRQISTHTHTHTHTSIHKESRLVGYIGSEDVGGGDL